MVSYINEPVKANFEAFVYEAELINANLTSAINSLKMKIPNRVFHEWCNILIQCQSDRSMKNTLPTIAQKFSDVRVVQSELEAMMQGPRREAITMMFLVIANVPLLYFLNKDWFHMKLFHKDRRTDYESRVMRLAHQALLSTAEIIKCVEQDVFSLPSERVLMEKVYGDSETTCQNIASMMKNSRSSQAVTLAVANLYLRQQIIFERIST